MKNCYNSATRKVLVAFAALVLPVAAFAQLDSAYFVSDSTWTKSTTTTPSDVNGAWSGVAGVLPDTSTYTIQAVEGQPYGYHSIDTITGAKVLKTTSNITYFRKLISLDTLTDLSARLRINVDDQMEVYINGILFAGEYEGTQRPNWKNPSFDVLIEDDGTIHPGYMGGDTIDSITPMDMDDVFNPGMNEVVVVVRNLATVTNLGGFCLRLDIKGTQGVPTVGFIVSDDDGFMKSTVSTIPSMNGSWHGVSGVLPPDSTYTITPTQGQPYGYTSMHVLPGSENLVTGNNVTYFRCVFDITKKDSLNARFQMLVDDGMEIYMNGFFIAREGNITLANYRNPAHHLFFESDGTVNNGHMGGQAFDVVTTTAIEDAFLVGSNTLVLAIMNQNKASDRGGFSFRMELDAAGDPIIVDNKRGNVRFINFTDGNEFTADVYPNPSNGLINVALERDVNFDVFVYDLNGRLMTSQAERTQHTAIDLSSYAPGIYMVRVVAGDVSYSTKVIRR